MNTELVDHLRSFRRKMTLWGLPLAAFEILVLITVARFIPIPDRLSIPTIVGGLFLFFLAGCFFYIPLWLLSDRLHKSCGLICPGCGHWLGIRSARHMRCTRCKGEIAHEG